MKRILTEAQLVLAQAVVKTICKAGDGLFADVFSNPRNNDFEQSCRVMEAWWRARDYAKMAIKLARGVAE